jgi:hypothetical protein
MKKIVYEVNGKREEVEVDEIISISPCPVPPKKRKMEQWDFGVFDGEAMRVKVNGAILNEKGEGIGHSYYPDGYTLFGNLLDVIEAMKGVGDGVSKSIDGITAIKIEPDYKGRTVSFGGFHLSDKGAFRLGCQLIALAAQEQRK